MKQTIWAKARTRIMDAKTGLPAGEWSSWQTNLVFDATLTSLATGSFNFASVFNSCKIGSDATLNEIVGGTTQFTQSGTVITTSDASTFFQSNMSGGIFKYGAPGDGSGLGIPEQYLSTIVGASSTATVLGTGASVPVAKPGSAWRVVQTTLGTPLTTLSSGGCVSSTYVTSPGNCGTFINGSTITLLRTFQFSTKTTPYTVNEIGYGNNGSNNGTCSGRVVLVTPDSISTSQFYVVQIAISFTVSPGSPASVNNVGQGIITTGTVMFNYWDCNVILTNGNASSFQNSFNGNIMDSGPQAVGLYTTGAYSPQSSIQQAQVLPNSTSYNSSTGTSYSSSAVGVATTTFSFTSITTAGQTVYAILYGQPSGNFPSAFTDPIFTLSLNTPFTLPTGPFNATFTYQRTYTRTLINGSG